MLNIGASSSDQDLKEFGLQSNYFEEYPWIGEPEQRVGENTPDDNDPYFNKLGGNPAWISESELDIMELQGRSEKDIPNLVPQIPKLKCGICSSKQSLVTQCYTPIAGYDRFLYVFGCNNASCSEKSNAWTCLRTQFKVDEKRVEKQKNKPKEEIKTEIKPEKTVTDWNQTVDDKELDDLLTNQASALQKVTKKEPNKKKKKKVSLTVSEGNLPCFALDIYEEPEDEELPEDSQEMKLLKQLKNEDVNEGVEAETFAKKFMSEKIQGINFKESNEGDKIEGEHTEEADDEHLETSEVVEIPESEKISLAFVHFQTVIAKCPNQSIRWQFGGKPLWVSDANSDLLAKYVQIKKKLIEEKSQRVALKDSEHSDEEDELDHEHDTEPNPSDYIPKCDKCGSARVFELEILPTLIYQLQVDKYVKKGVEEGMQFGCVCIFTCSNPSCDGYSEQERKQLTPNVTPKLKYSREYVFVQPGQ